MATKERGHYDVVIVGAGFAGLYLLYRLGRAGFTAIAFEQGDNVGGTWYWNRYPGARCDAESLAYSFSFSEPLEQEWEWTERYATQPEILRYAEHVADRFDLRRHIRFGRTVTAAEHDDGENCWTVSTDQGDEVTARYCIMATGCLSVPQMPNIPGLEDFAGRKVFTGLWPHDGVDFRGKRVGIIGTGSSAIQAIPVIAAEAEQLTVFQRTPNFSVPAQNYPLDPQWVSEFKKRYREHRGYHRQGLGQGFGDLEVEARPGGPVVETAAEVTDEEARELLQSYWDRGGAVFVGVLGDTLISPETNSFVAEFVREKIREIVNDPQTAEILCPASHPIGTKRICVDTGYYETFNRDNVSLVDLQKTPIERVTASGLATTAGQYEFDILVLATGFDAMTGALERIDVRGSKGQRLKDHWSAGPHTYLGLAVPGFPNLFLVTGPGSPSVLSNMLVSIEQHVDWMLDCLEHLREVGARRFEATVEAEREWVAHVNEVAAATLFPRAGSWYMGANIPGKPRVFMPYAGGVGPYREICDDVAANGYRGFVLD
ncbi:MAG TPA: NAD(P)/FAD-dependent oxidoreductase [Pseudomonadales bacterium]